MCNNGNEFAGKFATGIVGLNFWSKIHVQVLCIKEKNFMPYCSHTHTRTHTNAHTHTPQTHTQTHTHTCTHTHPLTRAHTHTHNTIVYTHMHTHTPTHTRTHPHTNIHSRSHKIVEKSLKFNPFFQSFPPKSLCSNLKYTIC